MRPTRFVDSSVLLLAVGDEHPMRNACRSVLRAAAEGEIVLHTSIEAIQEVLHHRLRRTGRDTAVSQARDFLMLCTCHDLTAPTMRRAIDLVGTTHLRGRDALHAATALASGHDHIVSTDTDFDDVPGLRRIAPEDALTPA